MRSSTAPSCSVIERSQSSCDLEGLLNIDQHLTTRVIAVTRTRSTSNTRFLWTHLANTGDEESWQIVVSMMRTLDMTLCRAVASHDAEPRQGTALGSRLQDSFPSPQHLVFGKNPRQPYEHLSNESKDRRFVDLGRKNRPQDTFQTSGSPTRSEHESLNVDIESSLGSAGRSRLPKTKRSMCRTRNSATSEEHRRCRLACALTIALPTTCDCHMQLRKP